MKNVKVSLETPRFVTTSTMKMTLNADSSIEIMTPPMVNAVKDAFPPGFQHRNLGPVNALLNIATASHENRLFYSLIAVS